MATKVQEVRVVDALRGGVQIHPGQDIETLPRRMLDLTMAERNGYFWVRPWFVATAPDGSVDFRAADGRKWRQAILERLCWVCGGRLGAHLTFVLGPMCVITRTTSEPACHLDCARWSAQNCPFLATPDMIRRPAPMPEGAVDAPGMPIERNPGVSALWTARDFEVFGDGTGRQLIHVGEPKDVEWWAQGRRATRDEVMASVESGLPILRKVAEEQGRAAVKDLETKLQLAGKYWPAQITPENN